MTVTILHILIPGVHQLVEMILGAVGYERIITLRESGTHNRSSECRMSTSFSKIIDEMRLYN